MAQHDIGTTHPLDEYVEAEIQRLLTEDMDIAEQGISIVRREHTVTLCGEVESATRRDEICRRVQEQFPDVQLSCDIGVIRAQAPSEAEDLP
jgi:hypothetical protein